MIRIFHQYISRKVLLLVALEGVLITAALVCGIKLRFWNEPEAFQFYTMLPDFAVQALAVVLCMQISFYYYELYDLHAAWRPSEHYLRLGQSLGAACLALSFVYFLFPTLIIGRGVFFISLAVVMISVLVARLFVDMMWHMTVGEERMLILGTGALAIQTAREINHREDLNLRVVGFVGTAPDGAGATNLLGEPLLGSVDQLQSLVRQYGVQRLLSALEGEDDEPPVRDLVRLRTQGVRVEDAPSALAALTGRISLRTVPTNWFIFSEGFRRTRWTTISKRTVDLVLSITGLILSSPVMALTALVVKLDSPGPMLYRQRRVGLGGETFEVLKFRSMRVDAEAGSGAQWASENDPRVTRIGRFLRQFRFDELPQFINVIRGEMSFTGPRPERPEFVERLRREIPFYDERHTVRPGITGWAQVCYPYGASVEDALVKLEYDLFYLKNMSFLFDCAIVFRTVKTVVFGRGGR